MFSYVNFLTFILFMIGIFGILINRQNVLVILMAIELMLLGITLNLIGFSVFLDDFLGQLYAVFILTIAAAESSIGLALLVAYYRVIGTITLENNQILKG
jgi:NADH-quinone oxidoreductase subunit K